MTIVGRDGVPLAGITCKALLIDGARCTRERTCFPVLAGKLELADVAAEEAANAMELDDEVREALNGEIVEFDVPSETVISYSTKAFNGWLTSNRKTGVERLPCKTYMPRLQRLSKQLADVVHHIMEAPRRRPLQTSLVAKDASVKRKSQLCRFKHATAKDSLAGLDSTNDPGATPLPPPLEAPVHEMHALMPIRIIQIGSSSNSGGRILANQSTNTFLRHLAPGGFIRLVNFNILAKRCSALKVSN